jgi:hypothetical protein
MPDKNMMTVPYMASFGKENSELAVKSPSVVLTVLTA